jgi:Domain of unknown function (DUF5658)
LQNPTEAHDAFEEVAVIQRDSERRRNASPFRLLERRTGFDRRHPSEFLHGLATNDRLFALLALAVLLMSAADWALTLVALRHGAVEGNPVLGSLIGISPLLAASFKGAATLLAVWAMWRGRKYRQIAVATVLVFLVYFALIAYHLGGLAGLGVI